MSFKFSLAWTPSGWQDIQSHSLIYPDYSVLVLSASWRRNGHVRVVRQVAHSGCFRSCTARPEAQDPAPHSLLSRCSATAGPGLHAGRLRREGRVVAAPGGPQLLVCISLLTAPHPGPTAGPRCQPCSRPPRQRSPLWSLGTPHAAMVSPPWGPSAGVPASRMWSVPSSPPGLVCGPTSSRYGGSPRAQRTSKSIPISAADALGKFYRTMDFH